MKKYSAVEVVTKSGDRCCETELIEERHMVKRQAMSEKLVKHAKDQERFFFTKDGGYACISK